MIENEDINVNNIDGNILLVSRRYNDINNYWIKEINSDGDSFNFDRQDIYRHLLESIFLKSEFIEKINPETKKEERLVVLEELKKSVNENIKLFDNHKSLFADLPKKKLLISEFRKRMHPESTKSDESLYKVFEALKEIQPKEVYVNSDLYKNIGFLEHNFHEEFYNFALYLYPQIENKFEFSNPYDSNYLQVYKNNFFNMGVAFHIHNKYNGSAFHQIKELEFYKVLNLQNTISYLKIKDNQRILYIIYRLSELLDENLRESWLKGILKEIQITRDYYNKKYKAVTWKSKSTVHETFVEELDALFEDKIETLIP